MSANADTGSVAEVRPGAAQAGPAAGPQKDTQKDTQKGTRKDTRKDTRRDSFGARLRRDWPPLNGL